jgi:cytochrome b6-f complex iron-sulfur subunit
MAVTRKEFLIRLAVGGVAVGTSSAIASFLASCSLPTQPQGTALPSSSGTLNNNTVTVDISPSSPLAQNGFAIVQYTGGSVLVARTSDGVYHAMTSICTHQGCSIDQYNSGSKEFICPCHGSQFSATGAVIGGPAPTALKQYATSISGTQLVITLS